MTDRPDILREYQVEIVPKEKPQRPAKDGLRTKFGGLPDSIQHGDGEEKTCPTCYQRMHFIAQIDSFEHNSKDNPNRMEYGDVQFMFGDVGMIYVWFCFNCGTPHASMECY